MKTEEKLVTQQLTTRYYISYTGVTLPLKLTNELDPDAMDNRITYFTGYYDENDLLLKIEKIVYSEVEFSHVYEYDENKMIIKAILIEEDEDPRTLIFDANGNMTEL